ncbi:MAG: branched-chain amino acid ABC transporter permease [Deltaproteobacteria bacterium]|nr:branched-chain amino acid ABC transporter permease [Deltaproteobacteria bacterium]
MTSFLSHVVTGALIGLLYALISMGFVIIYRAGRVFNLAQGEVLAIGAFLIWSFALYFNLPLWLAVLLGFGASIILGLIIERVILRPLVGEEMFALVMVTVGLLIFLRGLILVIWGADVHYIPPVFDEKGVFIGPLILDRGLVYGGIITILAAAFFSWFFNRTRIGLEMTAVAEDHQIALSLGLKVKWSIAAAWALSGVLCTMSAIIFVGGKGMTFLVGDIGMTALPVALFAGLESIGGLIVAGLIIGISAGIAEYFLDPIFAGGVAQVFPFVIMIIVLIIRPTGLFGWKTIERI